MTLMRSGPIPIHTRPISVRQILPFVLTSISLIATVLPGGAEMRKIIAETRALPEADGFHPGTEAKVALRVTLPEGFHMQSNRPLKPLLVPTSLKSENPPGVGITELIYPKTIELQQEDVEGSLAVFEQVYDLGVVLKLAPDLKPGELNVPLKLRYQPCDEGMCYPPVTVDSAITLNVVAAEAPLAAMNAEAISKIAFGKGLPPETASQAAPVPEETPETVDSGGPPPTSAATAEELLDRFSVASTAGGYLKAGEFLDFVKDAESGVKTAGPFEGKAPIVVILLVLLGGFALNLTPCVLPMIPINLAIIGAGAEAGSPRRGLLLGSVYGLAMAVVYGVLGLVAVFGLGSFGTLNSAWWFNLAIAILFVLLGLAMFDVFVIDFSRFSSKFNPKAKAGSVPLAFSMGAVSALLAGACVAPVVIQVVLFSGKLYAGGNRVALALPFMLGLGMAIPWPIAGAGLAAMPRPGAWMVRVKQAFGVLIIVMAGYYGYLTWKTCSKPAVVSTPAAATPGEGGWYDSLAEGLAAAERDNKPVFVDLWASWCKNCGAMEHTTFQDENVKAALAGYVKIKFAAEKPDEEPAKSVCKRFNAVGLPTYVILKPKPR